MPARSRAFTRASSTETGAAERAPAADSRPAGGIQSEAGGSGSLPPAEAATRRAAEAVSPFFYTKSARDRKRVARCRCRGTPSSRASRETRHEREQLERVGDEKESLGEELSARPLRHQVLVRLLC